ncbi:MAG TPA: hypothetical protein VEG68_19525 [Terriglobales bacterium]|nr:hypothetical protein [Terriglobales bacterium]
MSLNDSRFRPGDLVEVKNPDEILPTLDGDGTLDRLPFMPEMVGYCGKRFRVSKRVVKTCYYGVDSGMRKFTADDVVILEGVRCSGEGHDGCQKMCAVFWREAWLRKVDEGAPVRPPIPPESKQELHLRLKTKTSPTKYFCQASEILNATANLSRLERVTKCVSEVRSGNCTSLEMIKRIAVWVFWKARKVLLGPYARGSQKSTPTHALNLQSGDLIEIKPMAAISDTLDKAAYNRGLSFTPAMAGLCEQQHEVERRIDKLIVDGTGQMRRLHNTVFLKDSMCGCDCVAFGGCPRGEYAYWREIWLRPVEVPVEAGCESAMVRERECLPANS